MAGTLDTSRERGTSPWRGLLVFVGVSLVLLAAVYLVDCSGVFGRILTGGPSSAPVSLGACVLSMDASLKKGERQSLRIPVIAAAGADVDASLMDIRVDFFDRLTSGVIDRYQGPEPHIEWITAPVDWKEAGHEEVLDVIYERAEEDLAPVGRGRSRRAFFGYVVRLFYNDRLVGQQAEPETLLQRPELYTEPPFNSGALTEAR